MKTHNPCALLAAILFSTLFVACQKENSAPTGDPGHTFGDHLCRYQNHYFYTNYFGSPCRDERHTELVAEGNKVRFSIADLYHNFSLVATPVSEDSAIVSSQEVYDDRASKTVTYSGGLRVKNGVLSIRLKSSATSWWESYTYYRAERWSGAIAVSDYLGEYEAYQRYNRFYPYKIRIVQGSSANEVVLENVQGLNVAGRISGDTLYTEPTPMDSVGNYLTASTSLLQGRVLSISIYMRGPSYSPSYSSCDASVDGYKLK